MAHAYVVIIDTADYISNMQHTRNWQNTGTEKTFAILCSSSFSCVLAYINKNHLYVRKHTSNTQLDSDICLPRMSIFTQKGGCKTNASPCSAMKVMTPDPACSSRHAERDWRWQGDGHKKRPPGKRATDTYPGVVRKRRSYIQREAIGG